MTASRILALDLATTTGWALHTPEGVTSGTKSFALKPGESTPLRWVKFRHWVLGLIRRNAIELVVAEDTIKRHKSSQAASVAYGLATLLEEICEAERWPLQKVEPTKLKKHATGKGNAGKPAMIAAARERWPEQDIKDDNQADALCLLAWALDDTQESE